MTIFERIKRLKLPQGQYAVFGSALLEVWGLRKAADLDIIVTPELFEDLKKKGWKEKQGNGFLILQKYDADVTTIQNKPTDGDYCPDRLELIKNAAIIQDCPFVAIEEVIACKTAYGREKDIKDIKMIKKYLKDKS